MARIFKRPGDEFWWLDFTAGGRRQRVKTTTKSRRAAEDLLAEKRADITRVKLGLEVAPTSRFGTIGEAWEQWLKNWCPAASLRVERSRYNAHVKNSWFAREKLVELNGETLERFFAERAKVLSASSVNGMRRIIRCVFNSLIRHRMFRGVNPVRETKPMEEVEYAHQLLTEDEFKRVVPHLPDDWRPIAILAFTTGLRRGEIYALRRDRNVVDLERRTLTPRGSNSRNAPKGKTVKSVPLFDESLSVLRTAWDRAEPGGLLFPGANGKIRSPHLRPGEALRNAMIRAGFATVWDHRCRKSGCGGEALKQPDEQQRQCPTCGWIMWPTGSVRHVRFHDLRHSFAAYLLDRGVDLFTVSQLMRHSSTVITQKIYAHRTVDTLRAAMDRSSPTALARELERLAQVHPDLSDKLRAVATEAAQIRHHGSNVVPLIATSKG